MADAKVSIIVPIYNGSKYIDALMGCLLGQTYSNIEIILVDDGSKDESPAICDGYAGKDGRVRVIHKANGGLSSARNAGIEAASGEYVLFVDVDDAVTETIVEDNLALAEEHNADVVLFSFWFHVTEEQRKFGNGYEGDFVGSREDFFNQRLVKCIDPGMFSAPWNKLIRRSILEDNKISFDSTYRIYEDIVFAPKIMSVADKVVINDRPYYRYNIQSSGTLLTTWHDDTFAALKEFVRQYTKYCALFQDSMAQTAKLEELFLTHVFTYLKQTSLSTSVARAEKKKVIRGICCDMDVRNAIGRMNCRGKKRLMAKLICLKQTDLIIALYCIGGKA